MHDVLVELSRPSLEWTPERQQLIQQAAQDAQTGLLVVLTHWHSSDPIADFQPLSRFLCHAYTEASAVLAARDQPLLPVDVLIWNLRRRQVPQTASWVDAHQRSSFAQVLHEEPDASPAVEPASEPAGLFHTTALGGTFDHLHPGHKILLTMSAWITDHRIIVGITDEALLGRKTNKHLLESLEARTKAVHDFLRLVGPPHLELFLPPLQDVYGPTATEANCHAMVVSQESVAGAQAVAQKRQEERLPPLKLFVIDVLSPDADVSSPEEQLQTKMSSTAIREWLATHAQGRS